MAKNIFIMLLMVLSCVLVGCRNELDKNEELLSKLDSQMIHDSEEETLVYAEDYKDETEVKEELLSVLDNRTSFINEEGEGASIKDKVGYNKTIDLIPQKYTFVDMDRDGMDELVVHVSPYNDRCLILRYSNEDIYGYIVNIRSMIEVKKDGTCLQSSGAAVQYIARISFDENAYEWLIEAVEDNSRGIYQINGENVTPENAEDYFQKWENKSDVEWIEF